LLNDMQLRRNSAVVTGAQTKQSRHAFWARFERVLDDSVLQACAAAGAAAQWRS
jgi:hypothetical protein